ncbi:hypothetical protein SETIT_5G105700v2 [Setaria italica]|uniref:Pentatricopeptide repeat-containing protein n=1 Tax=Setaria italica TaxID=4555 RepID=A0A368R3C3_SETIT|nr:hypothetical protein SETIT_5G105700v2 [Setaria italica]
MGISDNSWIAIQIRGLFTNNRGYSNDVINLMQRMEQTGCKLDSDTYNLILNLYVDWKYEKGGLIPEPRTKILVKAIHMKKDGAVTEDQSANMTGKNLKLDPRSRLFHVHK